jgi:hypothetical protein
MIKTHTMNRQLSTEEIQEERLKEILDTLKRNRGMDLQKAVKEVNTKFPE